MCLKTSWTNHTVTYNEHSMSYVPYTAVTISKEMSPWATENWRSFFKKLIKLVRRNIKYLHSTFICRYHQSLSSWSIMFRKKSNYSITYNIRCHYPTHAVQKILTSCTEQNSILFKRILPNVNSLLRNPEAERAVIRAEGPGIGTTGMFLSTHNIAYIKIS